MKKYFITVIVAIMLVLAGCSCSKGTGDTTYSSNTTRTVIFLRFFLQKGSMMVCRSAMRWSFARIILS